MTKDEIIKVINEKYTGRAVDESELDNGCKYLTSNGNKCAVGLFIPEGHDGQYFLGGVKLLLEKHPDLRQYMPFSNIQTLVGFQRVHDIKLNDINDLTTQKQLLIEFVEKQFNTQGN